jgi:hypothetical protein
MITAHQSESEVLFPPLRICTSDGLCRHCIVPSGDRPVKELFLYFSIRANSLRSGAGQDLG